MTSHVLLSSAALQAEILVSLFNKHSEGGLLTVVVAATNDTREAFGFVQAALGVATWHADKHSDTEYFHASAEAKVAHLKPCYATQATHLLVFSIAALRSVLSSFSDCGNFSIYVLERPTVVFLPRSHTASFDPSSKQATSNIPTVDEWKTLWRAWDLVTLQMIPQKMLHQKPIDLRHNFLDMLLSKAIGGSPTEPGYFWNIFERGIDPHVDDPDHCHNHSAVPERDEDWPTIEAIIDFRNGVRARLLQLYDDMSSGRRPLTRNIARTLVYTMEHEGWHVETLLYMLIQRAGPTGTLPPAGFATPPWELLKQQWDSAPKPSSQFVTLGPTTITIGHDDSEGDDFLPELELQATGHEYGWDNESPAAQVPVGKFKASWRPVRTVYGPVPMDVAAEWPVLTTYEDLAAYATSKGGRLPTEPELQLFFDKFEVGFEGGANTGFRNWHALPATTGLESQQGRGSNGGVWEWTATRFDTHDGLVPTKLFTGYSTDFFDTKHQTVLGASYATIPRLGRRTVRNFWQRGYGYAWVGARVVWDM
ncbi:C-type lectin protein [Mycena amicta]|nr:C-type lectin protein [Mycena amicta]